VADERDHGLGMVGRFQLTRIAEDEKKIKIDNYASMDGSLRYFQNRLGGLGQYYLGPLQDLGVLRYLEDRSDAYPGYCPQGKLIAEAFDAGVPGDQFYKILETGEFAWNDLDSISEFCPCGLKDNRNERKALLDLFLARTTYYRTEKGDARRASLALILDLASKTRGLENYGFEALIRAATYSGFLPDGSEWKCEGLLKRARDGWAVYQRNELLSMALQGLFACVLHSIVNKEHGVVMGMERVEEIMLEILPSLAGHMDRPVGDVVEEFTRTLPRQEKWQSSTHEEQRFWRIYEIGRQPVGDKECVDMAKECIQVLFALFKRGLEENPYSDFRMDPGYFEPGEVHLQSLYQKWHGDWQKMTLREWVRWLANHWGVGRHFRVALRKLRGERRDTFRIRPLDGEYRVVEVPPPVFTTPRLGNAIQILTDLGLLSTRDGRTYSCTADGLRELEAILA